jgi:superoxide reductase
MTEKKQIYKCNVCGIVVEVLEEGAGELVCCSEAMALQEAKTEDLTKEKHVPWIQGVAGGTKVTVGKAALHPMEQKHYIQWIELLADGKSCRQFLSPGDAPEAVFPVTGEDLSAREFCNIHGLWKG